MQECNDLKFIQLSDDIAFSQGLRRISQLYIAYDSRVGPFTKYICQKNHKIYHSVELLKDNRPYISSIYFQTVFHNMFFCPYCEMPEKIKEIDEWIKNREKLTEMNNVKYFQTKSTDEKRRVLSEEKKKCEDITKQIRDNEIKLEELRLESQKQNKLYSTLFEDFNKISTCSHIFKQGKRKGLRCDISSCFDGLCSTHYRSLTRMPEKTDVWKKYFNTELGKCLVCKDDLLFKNMQRGHLISVANGGSNDISNIVPICYSCNMKIGSKNIYLK